MFDNLKRKWLGEPADDSASGDASSGDGEGSSGAPSLDDVRQRLGSEVRAAGGGKGRGKKASKDDDLDDDVSELFDADNWTEVASLPFNVRAAMTGDEGFLLSSKQERVLSTTLSIAMRKLLNISPAYVALAIFGINFTAYAGQKEIEHARRKREAAQ